MCVFCGVCCMVFQERQRPLNKVQRTAGRMIKGVENTAYEKKKSFNLQVWLFSLKKRKLKGNS